MVFAIRGQEASASARFRAAGGVEMNIIIWSQNGRDKAMRKTENRVRLVERMVESNGKLLLRIAWQI